jgi:uncharacterized protein
MSITRWKLTLALVLCSVLGAACPAAAQQPEAQLSEAKKALIRELVDVMEAQANSAKTADAILAKMEEPYSSLLINRSAKREDLTPEEKEKLEARFRASFGRFSKRYRERLPQLMGGPEFLEKVYYPTFGKYYTESELQGLIAFYKTPLGQKSLKVMPEMMADVMVRLTEILNPRIEKLTEELLEEEANRLEAEMDAERKTT